VGRISIDVGLQQVTVGAEFANVMLPAEGHASNARRSSQSFRAARFQMDGGSPHAPMSTGTGRVSKSARNFPICCDTAASPVTTCSSRAPSNGQHSRVL
jgi:hypothetical protein